MTEKTVTTDINFDSLKMMTVYTTGGAYDIIGVKGVKELEDDSILVVKRDGEFSRIFPNHLIFYDVKDLD